MFHNGVEEVNLKIGLITDFEKNVIRGYSMTEW